MSSSRASQPCRSARAAGDVVQPAPERAVHELAAALSPTRPGQRGEHLEVLDDRLTADRGARRARADAEAGASPSRARIAHRVSSPSAANTGVSVSRSR